MHRQITELTAFDLSKALFSRELSAEDAARAYLDSIAARDADIGAYLTVTADFALERARQVDRARASGQPLPPLAGVPFAAKDNICTRGIKTTCASRMLENFIPPYDAHVIERLSAQSAVLLGKLNMDEFAMGSTTENSYFKKTHNPLDLTRVPGGSSGGAAAAVASGQAAFALGSDTGGSIRQPAAFCGVVGIKPTYGAVSRYGLVAFASSLDQIGTLTRDVRDAALALGAVVGHDPRDATSLPHAWGDFNARLSEDPRPLSIALLREYFQEGVAPAVRDSVLAAARQYERMGARVEEVSMPELEHALAAYYVMACAEASSNLARFDGIRYGYRAGDCADIDELYIKTRSEGFGPEVKRRVMLGSFVLSAGYWDAYYKKALQVRTLLVERFKSLFERFDMLLSPVAPTTAYKLGEKVGNPIEMYMGDVCTVPVNIAGLPAISIPCGKDDSGLPIGMQLIGPHFGEGTLLRAAFAFEQSSKGGAR